MKYLSTFLIALSLFSIKAIAQIENPVSWSFTSKKVGDKKYDLYLTATLKPGWHIYAQNAGDGPEPTTITFDKNALVTLNGSVKEDGKVQLQYDKNFKSTLRFYSNKVSFVQAATTKANVNTVEKGSVTYMVCNDSKCLPPTTVPFAIKLNAK